jgi:hypothetical protein
MGVGVGAIFTSGSDQHPLHELAGAGAGFIFHPWVTRGYPKFQILLVSVKPAHLNSHQAQSFGPAKQYPALMSHTVTLGAIHLTHQHHSSLGAPIRHDLVIEFTSTSLKLVGDLKPGGCGCGRGCNFSPVGVAAGRFGWVLWVFVKPAPLPSLAVLGPNLTVLSISAAPRFPPPLPPCTEPPPPCLSLHRDSYKKCSSPLPQSSPPPTHFSLSTLCPLPLVEASSSCWNSNRTAPSSLVSSRSHSFYLRFSPPLTPLSCRSLSSSPPMNATARTHSHRLAIDGLVRLAIVLLSMPSALPVPLVSSSR